MVRLQKDPQFNSLQLANRGSEISQSPNTPNDRNQKSDKIMVH